jgi:cytochrome c peroxidase
MALLPWVFAAAADPGANMSELRRELAAHAIVPLPPAPSPDTPLVTLGRSLFYDKLLSGGRNIACATCHPAELATTDHLPTSIGRGGVGRGPSRTGSMVLTRNAPALFNLDNPAATDLFWDGHTEPDGAGGFVTRSNTGPVASSEFHSALQAQAVGPIVQNYEMRGSNSDPGNEVARECAGQAEYCMELVMDRLIAIREYRRAFAAAFPEVPAEDLGYPQLTNALSAFEAAAFHSDGSPFDRFLAGDDAALDPSELRGLEVFVGDGGCVSCHDGPLLSDFGFHGVAVPQVGPGVLKRAADPANDRGRFEVTGDPADLYRFRTPPLRNVSLTGPWMHDGAFASLRAAVVHHLDPAGELATYDPAQLTPARDYPARPDQDQGRLAQLDPKLASPVQLSAADLDALLAFLLDGLTDPEPVAPIGLPPRNVPSGLPLED